MSALAKIKKAAAQHEHDRQYDKALAQYARLLDDGAGSDEEVDVTLYNRAGDLALRAGDVPRAVTYFERAIDLYAAGGFLNNAIALAVKILRHAPGHLAAHHTLGVLYGRKGFQAEARQHLADYAAQMHRAGRGDEVGRTLGELATLGSGADEIAAVRELLTARAAGPEDAGALVKAFDEALGPVGLRAVGADRRAAPTAAIPLSELIEFEIRGPRLAPSSSEPANATALRWTTALPGDVPPLRLSAIAPPAPSPALELLDLGPVADHGLAFELDASAPAFENAPSDVAPLDVSSIDVSPFEVSSFEVSAFEAPSFEAPSFEVPSPELPSFELSDFEIPTAEGAEFEHPTDDVSLDLPFIVDVPLAAAAPPSAPRTAPDPAQLTAPELPVGELPVERVMDLGAWLRETELPASTRLVTPALRETGDENADFDAALHAFTAGIAHSVDAGDRESHYDLGVAFREMGLLGDAVREFQRALAAPGSGLREREALAQCFLDLSRPELALAALEEVAAAAAATASGETLIGVHYVLAEAARLVGRTDDARAWYVRVLASDYAFRDAAARLAALPPPGSSNRPR